MSEEKISLRRSGVWAVVAFGATLAVIVGVRLDQAALAAMVGVICGVGTSIPTSLLIVSLLRRKEERQGARSREQGINHSPPVVVIAAPAGSQLRQPMTWPGEHVTALPAQRQFSVIGEEETRDV
jgi:hypothetical protein